jgi:homeobox protein cut-like
MYVLIIFFLYIHHAQLKTLQLHLEAAPSKEEVSKLRSALRILQAAEYNVDIDTGMEGEGDVQGVEKALLCKLRRSEAEVTHLKVIVKDLTTEKARLASQLMGSEEAANDLRSLISKLEQDLVSTKIPAVGVSILQSAVSTSSVAEGTMVQVLTEQRDRLRVKILELESSNEKIENSVKALMGEMNALKSDNVKLYEKIKFLQSYRPGHAGHPLNSNQAEEIAVEMTNTMSRYQHEYEASMNPFSEFKNKENKRQIDKLNTAG